MPRDSFMPKVLLWGLRNAVRFTLLKVSLRRSRRSDSQNLQRKRGKKHTERTKKGEMPDRITKCSLCKPNLSQLPHHRHEVSEGFLTGLSIQNVDSLLFHISFTHLGIVGEMVNLHYYFNRIWSHLGDTPPLGMSLRLFPERFSWVGKTHKECGGHNTWSRDRIKQKEKKEKRHISPSLPPKNAMFQAALYFCCHGLPSTMEAVPSDCVPK